MNCLVIVNESPWGSGLALSAFRFARAAHEHGLEVAAVFFREDGVYNALPGRVSDAGTPDLADAWRDLARQSGARLLVCRSSADRRLRDDQSTIFSAPFEVSGLTVMFELVLGCDRTVSF